jgi:hypothetical protein
VLLKVTLSVSHVEEDHHILRNMQKINVRHVIRKQRSIQMEVICILKAITLCYLIRIMHRCNLRTWYNHLILCQAWWINILLTNSLWTQNISILEIWITNIVWMEVIHINKCQELDNKCILTIKTHKVQIKIIIKTLKIKKKTLIKTIMNRNKMMII